MYEKIANEICCDLLSLFTLASYDYDPILQTKAKVKETKQTV